MVFFISTVDKKICMKHRKLYKPGVNSFRIIVLIYYIAVLTEHAVEVVKMSRQHTLSVALLILYHFTAIYAEDITLSIPDGEIVGQTNSTFKNNVKFYSFRGIPFAKPPLGSLRFARPEKNNPWNGTWDARNDKNQCSQFVDWITGINLVGDEDCLYLNVYTPNYTVANLPVLFWIFGGVFLIGNNSYNLYGPDYFLEQNLIVVTVNYRLGVLGFLSTEDAACPGNWGIKDQLLALKWVRENIKYFGGDPNNVTVFGESAGAVSTHILLQTNLTAGLFKGAILNSGSTLNLWSLSTRAKETAKVTGVALGIFTTNTTILIEKLREVNVETLMPVAWLSAGSLYLENALRGLPFGPVIEPNVEGAVYLKPSENALQSGNFSRIPILMGFNSQEAVFFRTILDVLLSSILSLYLTTYDADKGKLTPWNMTQVPGKRLKAGIDVKNHYFQQNSISLDTQGQINFLSADQFHRSIRKAAADMSKFTSVYFYEFGYQGNITSLFFSGDRTYSGTTHTEDLPYLFLTSYSNFKYSTLDLKVSETMVQLWSNFVKFGNPTPFEDHKLNNTNWFPVNASSTNFNYLALNESLSMSVNPKQNDWEFYSNLWQKYGEESEQVATY